MKGLALAVSREGATLGTVDTRGYLSRHAAPAVKEGFRKLLNKQEEQYEVTKLRATTVAAAMLMRTQTGSTHQRLSLTQGPKIHAQLERGLRLIASQSPSFLLD